MRLRRQRPSESPWVEAALRAYEARTFANAAAARSLLFAVLAAWVFANYGVETGLRNLGIFVAFAGIGLLGYVLVRDHPERLGLVYLFVVVDAALLAYTLLAPGRTYPGSWPWQTVLRQPDFVYFLLLPALALLTFRPLLVAWTGLCVCLAWGIGTMLIAAQPEAVVGWADLEPLAGESAELARYLDPRYVHPDDAVVRIFVALLLSGLMAFAAWRARRLVFEQAAAARGRANLARYVAPSMVERLARTDTPEMGRARRLDGVAVLFADVQGFTALAEGLSPEATMGLLRGFHARMAEAVFRHQGTLDKFIGDGLMATFGTPEPAAGDAARALACARDMLATLTAWNRNERAAAGLPPLEVGIGLHLGPVTAGDIGGAARFEFAVIGDTVNVASRLERLTREVGLPLVVSEELLRRAEAEGGDIGGLRPLGPRLLRGRRGTVAAWGLGPGRGTRDAGGGLRPAGAPSAAE